MSQSEPTPVASSPASPEPAAANRPAKRSKLIWGILAALALVAAAILGAHRLSFALSHEETDDAQVDGDTSPVLPRVSGYVNRVLVRDNEVVALNQPLVEIDAHELDLKVADSRAARDGANAALATAQANCANARAALAVARANAAVAAVRTAKAETDLRRDTALFHSNAITDRESTDSQAAADIARTELVAAQRAVDATHTQVGIAEAQIATAHTLVATRQAELSYAELQRSYATVVAPIAGVVSRKSVEPGEFVQAGQTLLSIVSNQGAWVVANFKETQLSRMHPGQSVEFTVDSYPGLVFHGRVDSLAEATGARFALLPPDNASGNFVKVTQRVPVKIVLSENPPDGRVLRQGMSVDAAVLVRE
jgi:membrane fusion protein (multidrug efflux system)